MSTTPNRAFRESFPFPANCVVDGISGNGSLAPVGGPTGVINLSGLPVNLQWKLFPRTNALFSFQVENRDLAQDVLYPGQTVVSKDINFKVQDAAATAAIAASKTYGTTNTVTLTAKNAGLAGNLIQAQFIDPGVINSTLAVSVATGSSLILISYATNGAGTITSTPAQVKAAIDSTPAAAALVSTATAGSAAMAAIALAPLAGGLDAGVGTWADVASSNLVVKPGGVQYANLAVRQYFRVVATGGGYGELILTGDIFAHEITRF
jgi:hypothetical protein